MTEGQIMSFGFVLIAVLFIVEIFSLMRIKTVNNYHTDLLSAGYIKLIVTTAEKDHSVWVHSSKLAEYCQLQAMLVDAEVTSEEVGEKNGS